MDFKEFAKESEVAVSPVSLSFRTPVIKPKRRSSFFNLPQREEESEPTSRQNYLDRLESEKNKLMQILIDTNNRVKG